MSPFHPCLSFQWREQETTNRCGSWEETPSASSLVSARVTPAGRLLCVMTSCFVNRAGSLFCRVLTVWYSQLLISDSWGWRVSPDKTQFNQTSAVLLGDHPLTFLLLGVKHAGLGLELVEWTCFAPAKRARSHRTSRLSSRSSRGVRLQCKGCCRLHCWLRSRPRTQRMSLTRCCSGVSRKCKLLSTVTRLIYSSSDSSDGDMP